MTGCNYYFTIEKGEWMAATGPVNQLKTYEKRDDCNCLFKDTIKAYKDWRLMLHCSATLSRLFHLF